MVKTCNTPKDIGHKVRTLEVVIPVFNQVKNSYGRGFQKVVPEVHVTVIAKSRIGTILVGGHPVNPVEWWDPHWVQDRVERKLIEAGASAPTSTVSR